MGKKPMFGISLGHQLMALADGGISGSGTPVSYCDMYLYNGEPLAKNGSITVSLSGTRTNIVATVAIYDDAGNELISKNIDQSPIRLNLDEYKTATRWLVLVKRKTDNVEMSGTAYLQIERGDTATEYTPYIDPTTVTVRRCAKNILPYPYDGTCYGNGITFTDNGDGSITLNGTNNGESNSVFYLTKDTYLPFPASRYTGYLGADGVSLMGVVKGGGYKTLHNSFVLSETIELRSIYLQVLKGSTTTFNNVKIYPFAELGATTVVYEPYTGETQIPSSDGSVSGLTAVSPTMTLLTDKTGVNIECEYSRDTNMVIAEILEKITALGG